MSSAVQKQKPRCCLQVQTSYGSGAYLGRMVELIVKLAPLPLALDPVYETDMAEALKAMAIEGHGLAFLPASSVKKDLKAKRLVNAAPAGLCELTMEMRIYRERPEMARHTKAGAQALWTTTKVRNRLSDNGSMTVRGELSCWFWISPVSGSARMASRAVGNQLAERNHSALPATSNATMHWTMSSRPMRAREKAATPRGVSGCQARGKVSTADDGS